MLVIFFLFIVIIKFLLLLLLPLFLLFIFLLLLLKFLLFIFFFIFLLIKRHSYHSSVWFEPKFKLSLPWLELPSELRSCSMANFCFLNLNFFFLKVFPIFLLFLFRDDHNSNNGLNVDANNNELGKWERFHNNRSNNCRRRRSRKCCDNNCSYNNNHNNNHNHYHHHNNHHNHYNNHNNENNSGRRCSWLRGFCRGFCSNQRTCWLCLCPNKIVPKKKDSPKRIFHETKS